MGFLRDLLRKYHGSAGCHTLEDFIDTEAEKHLRRWVKNGLVETCKDYAKAIIETNLRYLRKEDQLLLAQDYYDTTGSIADDFSLYGLDLAVELAAQVKVDTLVSCLFLNLAHTALAIRDDLLKHHPIVEIKHQNPYRDQRPISVFERFDMSVYEYLLDDGSHLEVYVNDYPYLAFVVQKDADAAQIVGYSLVK